MAKETLHHHKKLTVERLHRCRLEIPHHSGLSPHNHRLLPGQTRPPDRLRGLPLQSAAGQRERGLRAAARRLQEAADDDGGLQGADLAAAGAGLPADTDEPAAERAELPADGEGELGAEEQAGRGGVLRVVLSVHREAVPQDLAVGQHHLRDEVQAEVSRSRGGGGWCLKFFQWTLWRWIRL